MLLWLLIPQVFLQAAPPPAPPSAAPASQAAPAAPTLAPPPSPQAHSRTVHLDDAVQRARQNQPAILQARAVTDAAEGRREQARAGLLPQVTGTALYEKIHGTAARSPTTTGAGGTSGAVTAASGTASTYDYWSFGASASQLIWDFNQTIDKFRAAGRTVEAQKIAERTADTTVLLNVRRAYFNARAQRAVVQVAAETLANEQRHLNQIQGFVKVGTRPEIDLVQERTLFANDQVALITAQGNYEIARAQLNQAMGFVGDTDYDVTDETLPVIAGEEGPDEPLVQSAYMARPEIAQLEKTREANELTVSALKGGYGPSLSAIGGASYAGTSLDSLVPNWNIGAQLTWPLFQGGLTVGQVREAKANVAAVNAQIETEKLQVRFDVQQAVLLVRTAKATINAANDALANARERLRLAEGRYAQGVGSIIELGDAQVALTNAAGQVVQSEFNLASARAQLLAALGKP